MKRKSVIMLLAILVAAAFLLSGCSHVHQWKEATCTTPQTCLDCGETKGEALPHTWVEATCTTPKACTVCGAVEGDPLPHVWTDATCTTPKICTVCGIAEGDPLGHEYSKATPAHSAVCSRCGEENGKPAGLFEMLTGASKVRINTFCTSLWDLLAERIASIGDTATKSDMMTLTSGEKTIADIRIGKEEPDGFQAIAYVPETSETIRLRVADNTVWLGNNSELYSINVDDLKALMTSGNVSADGGIQAFVDAGFLEDLTNLLHWLGDADISNDGNTFEVNISLNPFNRIEEIAALFNKYAEKYDSTAIMYPERTLRELQKTLIAGGLHFSLDTQSRCRDWQLTGSFSVGGYSVSLFSLNLSCQNRIIAGSLIAQNGSHDQDIIPIDGYMGEKQFSLNIHDGSDDNTTVFALQADWAGHFSLSLVLPQEQFALYMNGRDENGRADLYSTVSVRYDSPVSICIGADYAYDEENDLLTVAPDFSITGGESSRRNGKPNGLFVNADGLTLNDVGSTTSIQKVETADTGFEYIISTESPYSERIKRTVFSFEKILNGFTLKQLNRTDETGEKDETVWTFTETSSDIAPEPFSTENAQEITGDMLQQLFTAMQ